MPAPTIVEDWVGEMGGDKEGEEVVVEVGEGVGAVPEGELTPLLLTHTLPLPPLVED